MLAVQYLIAVAMVYLILFHFLNFEKQRRILWLNIIVVIILGMIDIFRQIHYGYQPIRQYDALLGIPPVIFMGLYMLGGFRKWRLWLATVLAIFVAFFVNTIAVSFLFGILELDILLITTYGIYSMLGAMAALLLFVVLYLITRLLKLKINIFSISKSEITFIIIYTILFGFLVSSIHSVGVMSENYIWGVTMSVLALITGLTSIYFILYLATQKTIISDIKIREIQQELIFYEQATNYQRMIDKDEELKAFRHSILDETKFLIALLTNLDITADKARQRALDYIKTMQTNSLEIEQMTGYDTGSNAVNASWFSLTNDEKYSDIIATWKGKIPETTTIGDRDLVLLFANILNNAFEAATQSLDKKYVAVEVKSKLQGFSVLIKNSFNGQIKKTTTGDFLTSKPDKKNHGIGTKIIKKIVDDYQGHIDLRYSDSEFITLISFSDIVTKTE